MNQHPHFTTLSLLAALFLVSGCGHEATKAECEEIFNRSAEIELAAQKITEPTQVKQRVADARAARGDELLAGCVGKRVTDKAMVCIRNAKTAESFDACLE